MCILKPEGGSRQGAHRWIMRSSKSSRLLWGTTSPGAGGQDECLRCDWSPHWTRAFQIFLCSREAQGGWAETVPRPRGRGRGGITKVRAGLGFAEQGEGRRGAPWPWMVDLWGRDLWIRKGSKLVWWRKFKYVYIYLFIYLRLCWVFAAARAFLCLWRAGFSCCEAEALEHRLSSRGAGA